MPANSADAYAQTKRALQAPTMWTIENLTKPLDIQLGESIADPGSQQAQRDRLDNL